MLAQSGMKRNGYSLWNLYHKIVHLKDNVFAKENWSVKQQEKHCDPPPLFDVYVLNSRRAESKVSLSSLGSRSGMNMNSNHDRFSHEL